VARKVAEVFVGWAVSHAGSEGTISSMSLVLALTHQTGRRLAEVGFLLIVIAGLWLTAAQIPRLEMSTARAIIAGVAFAIGGVLPIIATHWGHFG
jgi:multidrug transporter EmrE-like cation transporter